jgi:hypothetical protein
MNLEELNESGANNIGKLISKFTDKKKQISPKKLSNWEGLRKFTIDKSGPNMTLNIGDDTKDRPLTQMIKYMSTKNYIDVTLPLDLSLQALKQVEAIIVGIVNKFDQNGKPSSYKELAVKVLPDGMKIGRVKHNKEDEEYSEEDPQNNDKGANKPLESGETIRIYVGKISTKMPKLLKESKTIDRFEISTSEDEDGDIVHTVKGVKFGTTMDSFLDAIFDTKNNEDVEAWLRDLPMGDTVQDTYGNGFVVSDITDHLE